MIAKRTIAALFAAGLACGLAGCGEPDSDEDKEAYAAELRASAAQQLARMEAERAAAAAAAPVAGPRDGRLGQAAPATRPGELGPPQGAMGAAMGDGMVAAQTDYAAPAQPYSADAGRPVEKSTAPIWDPAPAIAGAASGGGPQ